MAAEDICKDYTSSLEDLTFNSKPLINMLTMLAEENSQHAAEIVKLIEKRIYEVSIEQKLPSLYLMDSIVKNIGKEYISAVSPCIVALFTHVFEQADEKIRMSMFKLRNTWSSLFLPKTLHELDCSVHKRDPGWPVVEPPPPSPSIHINPKFLSKVEETVEESTISSSSDEAKIMDEFERKKKELEQLQGDQMRKQMMQLEELKMKYDLIKKKQEKDRQNLLKQQQEQILKMRLEQEELDSAEESSSDSKLSEASATVKLSSRDPRLKKLEQVTDNKTDTDTSTDNAKVEAEKIEEKPSVIDVIEKPSVIDVIEKPVGKVGFDMEFVPLDKEDDNVDITPVLTYNRDRPLGKNRYFRKDPKAKIMKSDSDSGSDFGDAKKSRSDKREDVKSINRKGKRLRGGGHHNDRHMNQPAKENDRDMSSLEVRKRSDRGRARASRRHSGDRPRNTSNDRPGEPTGDPTGIQPRDRPDFVDHHRVRPGENRRGDRHAEHATGRPGVRPGDRRDGPGDRRDGPSDWDRPGRRPGDHPGQHPRDIGKENKRRRRRSEENEDNENIHSRHDRREEWSRGRGQRSHRARQGHAMGREDAIEGRLRHEFPEPVDNTGRLPERRDHDQGFDRPDGAPPFEAGFGEEPPFKKSRPSPPRPLFSEREIFEIRERRRDSPPPEHSDRPLKEWLNKLPGFHEPWQHDVTAQPPLEFFDNQFPNGPRSGPRPPRFPPPDDRPPFGPRGMSGEFLNRPPHRFPGDVEIPLELTLDNEAEILRSADRRLRMGELSLEQHHELLEKLHQLYELQKWQRRRSLDMPPQHEPGYPFIPQPALHPDTAAADLPPRGRPMMPEPHLNNDHNQVPVLEGMVVGEPMPDRFAHQPQLAHAAGVITAGEEGRSQSPAEPTLTTNHEPSVLPDQINPSAGEEAAPPSNLVMEKQTVDDLFKRLMNFGIITKVSQGASPTRAMTPPVVKTQILQEIPVPQIPELPEIKLTLDHLRRRYDGVIMELHRGTQCSSCGLRFKEADNENYRKHLDWHFRINRKEKETLTAHRSWFITTDDWLEFESSEDPKLKARSAVFEAESEGESEKSEDLQEGSCPVLMDDTEAERACDICFEKFETFWDETSEDWHYKNAVRVDGKTYHYLCYQDTKEADDSDVEASDGNENTEDNDDNNDASEMQNEEVVTKESSSITDNKLSIVTEDTTVKSEVDPVVQGGDDVAVDNTNKEEIKTESS